MRAQAPLRRLHQEHVLRLWQSREVAGRSIYMFLRDVSFLGISLVGAEILAMCMSLCLFHVILRYWGRPIQFIIISCILGAYASCTPYEQGVPSAHEVPNRDFT